MAGNSSGVTASYATVPTSPIRTPVSGTLLRLKPNLSGGEIVSDGFRNAYDFAFNAAGDFFTYDSDDERDISLPWYLPTQVFHILPLSNAGYVTAGLKRPARLSGHASGSGNLRTGIAHRRHLLSAPPVSTDISRWIVHAGLDHGTDSGCATRAGRGWLEKRRFRICRRP